MSVIDSFNRKYRLVNWAEFVIWIQGKRLVSTEDGQPSWNSNQQKLKKGETELKFDDGSSAIVQSSYEEDYSELTPGEGIQAPSVFISL